ncbi:hypothetical protein BIW11_12557 [Tropilaelaps mercedesae]|uniref:Uncharacterized protein n=1 Tax=Tropilaelaps mercedesae TaxID=418985 RepID=A0A1V9X6D2_9ACAR|nr:hypothetical protein BIW11_12557 [Tropilaelaps mercedesae]
MDRQENRQMDR